MSPTMIANISWAAIVIAATVLNHFGIGVNDTILHIIEGMAGYQGAITTFKATTSGLISVNALQQAGKDKTLP